MSTKKWNSYRRRHYQTPKDNSNVLLIMGLISVSALIALKNNSHLTYDQLTQNDYFNSSSLNYKFNSKFLEEDKNFILPGSHEFKSADFTKIDNYASSIRYDGTSVSELASLLSHYAKTEPEKARIIYSWIAYNITYDVPAFYSGNYGYLSPQGVLRSRKGVCSGYAVLYESLARAMGLEVSVIEGYSKGYGYVVGNTTQVNHAWNAVKINNGWYLLDATWGAGKIDNGQFNKQLDPYYFATPPEQFILKHFPAQEKWQLLEKHYSKQQFDTAPEIFPQFFKDRIQLVTHYDQTIQADGRFQVVLSAPEDTVTTSQLKSNSTFLNDTYTLVQKKDNKIILTIAPPVGNSELEIFSKNKYMPGAYYQAIAYKVYSKSAGEEFPKIYSTFLEKNSYLYSPLYKHLPVAQSVYFKLEVPNALEVQVIDASSNTWTQLTRFGSTFVGNISVNSLDKIKVSAKFSGDEQYWTLVEYN